MSDDDIRSLVLAALIAFCAFFALITVSAAIDSGFDFLKAISLAIVAMFAIGLIGAIRNPPDED